MRDDLNSFKTTKSVLSLTSLHFYIAYAPYHMTTGPVVLVVQQYNTVLLIKGLKQ